MKGKLYKNADGDMASSLFRGPIIINPRTDTAESKKQYAVLRKRWCDIMQYMDDGTQTFHIEHGWRLDSVSIKRTSGNILAFDSGLNIRDNIRSRFLLAAIWR